MGYLVDEAGAGAVAMMRSIKRALDPKNIMNPGKVISPRRRWACFATSR
jgi:D-lactate dehydrogenase (cytochrome)